MFPRYFLLIPQGSCYFKDSFRAFLADSSQPFYNLPPDAQKVARKAVRNAAQAAVQKAEREICQALQNSQVGYIRSGSKVSKLGINRKLIKLLISCYFSDFALYGRW